jgi:hypothetical protein
MMSRVALLFVLAGIIHAQQGADWTLIETRLGRKGTEQNGTYKVSFPRTDLHVRVGGTNVEAAAALGSWMAFHRQGASTIADGDLVLTAEELGPVIAELRKANLTVTGVHNHLAGETPQVMYVHFFATGTDDQIAQGLHAALAKTKTPQGAARKSAAEPLPSESQIEAILGKKGTANGRVLAFSFPRPHSIAMAGHVLDPAMGMATAINFQPSPAGVAATGDFVLKESETQTVLSALSAGGIRVTAMHNHLLEDDPRMVFVHYWAEGKAEDVARGLKAALDASTR